MSFTLRNVEVAGRPGLDVRVEAGRVAAIGPIVEAALTERGVRPHILTDKPFVMKHLVGLIAEKLGASG